MFGGMYVCACVWVCVFRFSACVIIYDILWVFISILRVYMCACFEIWVCSIVCVGVYLCFVHV